MMDDARQTNQMIANQKSNFHSQDYKVDTKEPLSSGILLGSTERNLRRTDAVTRKNSFGSLLYVNARSKEMFLI